MASRSQRSEMGGVRRGPPYPIEDKILRKGTRLGSVRTLGEDTNALKRLYAFNMDDDYDKAVYEGPYAIHKAEVSGQYVVEQIFTVNKDLKMPTSQERFDTFKKIYSSDPVQYAKDLKKLQADHKEWDVGPAEAQNVNLENPQTDADYKAIFSLVNDAMDHVNNYEIAKKYSDIMSKMYDAMVDDDDQGYYNYAHDPIIIFKVNECLSKYGDERLLDYKEQQENFNTVWREMAKTGEDVTI